MKDVKGHVKARLITGAFLVAVLAAVVGSWMARHQPERRELVILKEVQTLGELRTVRHTYRDVLRCATSREPADWAAPIPGAAGVVRTLTKNDAIVTYLAEVDAGVDLTRAKLVEEASGPVIVLPRAQIYPPRVKVRIEWRNTGLFWRDENLAAAAQREAEAKVTNAAEGSRIIERAESEVRDRLSQLGQKFELRFES
ncbi:MAG: DUF4230 domain-containing protein [Fimbriimonadaceae bacterium]|nr:DUF4230 domain-containing protein [Fimbriimonadaceae bacterium]QYK58729.1 MAG: DUF4230 domain-containing protein [Fimbriimonadaceae bacterium]